MFTKFFLRMDPGVVYDIVYGLGYCYNNSLLKRNRKSTRRFFLEQNYNKMGVLRHQIPF